MLYAVCKERGNFVFINKEVRKACARIGFGNPFDATKIDSSLLLPDAMSADDAFVVHLGNGKHKFVFGIGAELSKRNLTCELRPRYCKMIKGRLQLICREI